jgi:predicted PurR-regulated permease PerM
VAETAGEVTEPPRGNWRTQAPLFVVLFLVLLLAIAVFRYFLLTFVVAGSVALMLAPLQRYLRRHLGGRRWLAAGLLVVLVTVAIAVPVVAYGTLLAQQAVGFVEWLRPWLEPAAIEKLWREDLPRRYPLLMAWVRQSTGGGALPAASSALSRVLTEVNAFAQSVLTGLAEGLIDLGIFLMMLFFLVRDGDQLRDAVRGISPLTRGQETEIMDHLTNTVKGVLQSMVVVPLAQGAVALVGFLIFGVPSPVLWSVMVVLASVVPLLGSPLAWVPAGLYLLTQGREAQGIGLLVYGAVVIAGIDNVIKPLILKGAAQIHTMLGFLSILGGIYAFGPKGLIAGPVTLSLVLSAYRIYRYDVLRWRQDAASTQPRPPSPRLDATGTRAEEVPALSSR